MRLWSIHPRYLDAKGIVALWREALLAKNVLEGNTRGYRNHPQLHRFKLCQRPVDAINQFLTEVHTEASRRGYKFDGNKINSVFVPQQIPVTRGQVAYEKQHLATKLQKRDPGALPALLGGETPRLHSLFTLVEGGVEPWEKV